MAMRGITPSNPLKVLKSVEEVTEKLTKRDLVLILFNSQYADEQSIENKFNSWRTTYENKYNLYVYKCIVSKVDSPLKLNYQIKKQPTFILFRKGQPIARLDDAGNLNPNVTTSSKDDGKVNPSGELPANNPEEQLKRWLDKECSKT